MTNYLVGKRLQGQKQTLFVDIYFAKVFVVYLEKLLKDLLQETFRKYILRNALVQKRQQGQVVSLFPFKRRMPNSQLQNLNREMSWFETNKDRENNCFVVTPFKRPMLLLLIVELSGPAGSNIFSGQVAIAR